MNEFYPADTLVITRPWAELSQTAKYERMLQRREKILKDLNGYQRQLQIIEALFEGIAESGGRILEVACGMGFHLLELSARGWNMIGLEIDPSLCALANDAATRFGLPARSLAGDACAIPVEDHSLDAVFSLSFFEHVYDVNLALSEQIRVLKPGGLLLISDGNMLNPKTLLDLLVFYPLRTRGQRGGLKWLLTKGEVHENLYGYLPLGRDEDIKTPAWWKRRIQREPQLNLLRAKTGGYYTHPYVPGWMQIFLGGCVILAEKL